MSDNSESETEHCLLNNQQLQQQQAQTVSLLNRKSKRKFKNKDFRVDCLRVDDVK